MKIEKRFANELFENKKVQYYNDLYRKNYRDIWKCDHLFIDFLLEDETSLKLDIAKRIYGNMQLCNDIIIPSHFISNMVYFQQSKLVSSNKGYIPQDHVLHCISLYIFGVYSFFNMPLFIHKIVEEDRRGCSIEEKIMFFIKKWRAFSLYHDLGYFFEGTTDKSHVSEILTDEKFEEYNSIFEYILFIFSLRDTARTITNVSLLHRSKENRMTESEKEELLRVNWILKASNSLPQKANQNKIRDILDRFSSPNAFKIRDIHKRDSIMSLIDILNNQSCLYIIRNKLLEIYSILEVNNNNILELYISKKDIYDDNKSNKTTFTDFLASISLDSFIDCYVMDGKGLFYFLPRRFQSEAGDFYDDLPEQVKVRFTLINDLEDIQSCYFEIASWLRERTESCFSINDFHLESGIYETTMAECYKKGLSAVIRKTVDSFCSLHKISAARNVEDSVKKFINYVVEMNDDKENSISKDIIDFANKEYQNQIGIPINILHLLEDSLWNIRKETVLASSQNGGRSEISDRINKLFFLKKKRKKIQMSLFSHGEGKGISSFEHRLYEAVEIRAKRLKMSFEEIKNYQPAHSNLDHGLVSAGLIYQSFSFSQILYELTNSRLETHYFEGALKSDYTDNEMISYNSDVIFSVLLHNIYNMESDSNYGLDYKHSIDYDPFSYFCAFHDTLQVWFRPKQIDFSKSDLPLKHYLRNNFDITVSNGRILFLCEEQDVLNLRNTIAASESFLPGISMLVGVTQLPK